MSVREQNAGRFAGDVLRTIEVARHEEARRAFKINFLNGVFAAIDLAVDHRIQRRLRRHGKQTLGDEDLPPHTFGPLLPRALRRWWCEWEVAIQVFQRLKSDVVGQFALGQDARSSPRNVSDCGDGQRQTKPDCQRVKSRGHSLQLAKGVVPFKENDEHGSAF